MVDTLDIEEKHLWKKIVLIQILESSGRTIGEFNVNNTSKNQISSKIEGLVLAIRNMVKRNAGIESGIMQIEGSITKFIPIERYILSVTCTSEVSDKELSYFTTQVKRRLLDGNSKNDSGI